MSYLPFVDILLLVVDLFTQKDSFDNHAISKDVYRHMHRDLCAVVTRLVLFLRNPESYKEFLACRETDAQRLLDLLQDVSTSNHLQMLVPTE